MKATARHILVGSKVQCELLKREIDQGADFSHLAMRFSSCPTGRKGGLLGEFGQGEMVKEFDEVVFRREIDKVHGPVKTRFGYHLIEITSRTS